MCSSSCSTYGTPLPEAESVTHVCAQSVTHVRAQCREGEEGRRQNSESLDFSLAYTEDEAWIAVRRGGFIGIDIMRLESVPEAEAIAQNYFSPADRSALQQSTDPVRNFALAWTQLEARCKCLKQGLTEWSESLAIDTKACTTESLIIQDKLALSVATAPQDFRCRRNA